MYVAYTSKKKKNENNERMKNENNKDNGPDYLVVCDFSFKSAQ